MRSLVFIVVPGRDERGIIFVKKWRLVPNLVGMWPGPCLDCRENCDID